MAIEGTLLYASLEPRWRGREEWPDMLEKLNICHELGLVREVATNVDSALTWDRTPQGGEYWMRMNDIDYHLRRGNRDWHPAKPKEKVYAAVYR